MRVIGTFKAVAPVLRHEIPLTTALWHWRSDTLLPVLAVDVERGWMLLPDGGRRLREIMRRDHDTRHWEHTLAIYAQTQIALAAYVADILACGTPDHRLPLLPQHYDQLLAAVPALEVESAARLSAEELHQLQHLSQRVRDLCIKLSTYPIPATLNHGDLHDGNIFIRDGQPIFFDWGDASVTHPFVSLRTTFASVERTLGVPEGAAAELPLRDAYLAPWRCFASAADVRAAFQIAQRIAPLLSAFSWSGLWHRWKHRRGGSRAERSISSCGNFSKQKRRRRRASAPAAMGIHQTARSNTALHLSTLSGQKRGC